MGRARAGARAAAAPRGRGGWREYGWRAEPDVAAAQAEHEAFCALLEEAGRRSSSRSTIPGNPDAIYTYDPTLVGRDGAVLLLPGKEGRRREPEATGAALEAAGVPVAGRIERRRRSRAATRSGSTSATLLVGIGYRTKPAARRRASRRVPGRRRGRVRPAALERRRAR